MKLKDDMAISFSPAYSTETKLTASIFTPKGAYLIVKSPKVRVFGTAGLRYWHLGTTLTLEPPPPSGREVYESANWADFVAGGRFVVPISQTGLDRHSS